MPSRGLRTLMVRFSPEVDLLIACTRTTLEPIHKERILKLTKKGIDWETLYELARVHGLRILLYRHLKDLRPAGAPVEFLDNLREHYQENTRRNLFLTGELGKLLAVFDGQNIPVISYKGLVLAESVYGNLSLRQFNDFDLLIRREDIPRTNELLFSLGYAFTRPHSKNQIAANLKYAIESEFFRNDGKVNLDVHWSVAPKELRLDAYDNQVWQRAVPHKIAGVTARTLSLVDHMLVLCLHGSKPVHGWLRLSWICDIAEMAHQFSEADWQLLWQYSVSCGVERMVDLGLFLASDLPAAPLPAPTLERIQAVSGFSKLSQQIYQRLFRKGDKTPGALESTLIYLRVSTGLRESARLTLDRIVTPTYEDWQELPLPVWLYYLYRPFRLLRKYLTKDQGS
jgi:hypothetical protein